MKFTQKRTCKGCKVEGGDSPCTVEKQSQLTTKENPFAYCYPKMPKEPCFKPLTNGDWVAFIQTYGDLQAANIKIHRVGNDDA
ncbi:MAG: hypothetical protein COB36_12020 [Alphaproteobacteria bacterium]|nr:MAG: hypothetical protein COB36_12020 [Alphaproteobacteria bacterium]